MIQRFAHRIRFRDRLEFRVDASLLPIGERRTGPSIAGLISRRSGIFTPLVPTYAPVNTILATTSRWMLMFHWWLYPPPLSSATDSARTGRKNE